MQVSMYVWKSADLLAIKLKLKGFLFTIPIPQAIKILFPAGSCQQHGRHLFKLLLRSFENLSGGLGVAHSN